MNRRIPGNTPPLVGGVWVESTSPSSGGSLVGTESRVEERTLRRTEKGIYSTSTKTVFITPRPVGLVRGPSDGKSTVWEKYFFI